MVFQTIDHFLILIWNHYLEAVYLLCKVCTFYFIISAKCLKNVTDEKFNADQKWRDMRATLSPAFTGSKMRLMYEFIIECAQQMTDYLQQKADKEGK